jgi:hypothetical protein
MKLSLTPRNAFVVVMIVILALLLATGYLVWSLIN